MIMMNLMMMMMIDEYGQKINKQTKTPQKKRSNVYLMTIRRFADHFQCMRKTQIRTHSFRKRWC